MGVLGALGALPADVDVSVGSVLPEARALKGRLESSTLSASLRPPWAERTPLIAPAVAPALALSVLVPAAACPPG